MGVKLMLRKVWSVKVTISILLLAIDSLSVGLAATFAFALRFRSTLFDTEGQPSLAIFDYKLILGFVALGWLLTLGFSGIYGLKHDSLFILNLQGLLKRSLVYFFSLGFLSFVTRASFSRTIFVALLISGLFNLIFFRLS